MEKYYFYDGCVYQDGVFKKLDILVEDGIIKEIGRNLNVNLDEVTDAISLANKVIIPGFSDVHVHFREPGFCYKETIATGSRAALNGGYLHVCTMPNLNPVPDSLEHLQLQLDRIKETAVINVHPYGSITQGEKGLEVSEMEELAPYVIGFSDDGNGIANKDIMYEAMVRANNLGKIIAGHCEVKTITGKGYINDGIYARMHNHLGIPNASEYEEVRRNIEIAKQTKCHFHVCHVSCQESIDLIRKAKNEGVNITCETAPHYLLLSEMDMKDDGCYRFQPPLRRLCDRLALLQALKDGNIDMIATDHAPHSKEEKSRGIKSSLNGIVGLEYSFPILYTRLVLQGIIPLEKLLSLLIDNPKKIFGIGSKIEVGLPAEFNVWDLEAMTVIDANKFASMGRSTPFNGQEVYGQKQLTLIRGVKYDDRR